MLVFSVIWVLRHYIEEIFRFLFFIFQKNLGTSFKFMYFISALWRVLNALITFLNKISLFLKKL